MVDVINSTTLANYPGAPTTNATAAQIDLVIRLTNGLVKEITGDLATYPVRVESAALEAAARALRNPDGASEEQIDDYSTKRPMGQESAGVYLTAWERGQIEGAVVAKASARSAYIVSLTGD